MVVERKRARVCVLMAMVRVSACLRSPQLMLMLADVDGVVGAVCVGGDCGSEDDGGRGRFCGWVGGGGTNGVNGCGDNGVRAYAGDERLT